MIKDKDKCSTQADFDKTGCNLGEDFISRKVQSDFKKRILFPGTELRGMILVPII